MNLEAMSKERDQVEELLGVAVEMLCEPLEETATPGQAAVRDSIVRSYVLLAGESLARFEEAVNGR